MTRNINCVIFGDIIRNIFIPVGNRNNVFHMIHNFSIHVTWSSYTKTDRCTTWLNAQLLLEMTWLDSAGASWRKYKCRDSRTRTCNKAKFVKSWLQRKKWLASSKKLTQIQQVLYRLFESCCRWDTLMDRWWHYAQMDTKNVDIQVRYVTQTYRYMYRYRHS